MKKSMTAQALAKPLACRCGTGILPVFHGRDAHATRGFARTSVIAVGLSLVSAVCAAETPAIRLPSDALKTRPITATADAILAKGFTVTLEVDFDGVKDNETLYEAGSVKLAFRLAGKTKGLEGYDSRGGNYLNFPMPDGSCPVIEATICNHAGRVGIPLGFLARKDGVHTVMLNFSPVHWSICVDGHVDNDMPIPQEPVTWPAQAQERIFSPRVRSAVFVAPAKPDALPQAVDAKRVTRPIQYWTPDDHNAWVGDVAVGTWKGRFHVFYLFDRRHHGSGAGKGRHYFAHLSSDDLANWDEHPLAVPIDDWWECIGTGTPFELDGKYCLAYGLHTERMMPQGKDCPVGGTYAVSEDGIHFRKTGVMLTSDRNPSVYNRADGRLGMGTKNGQLYYREGDAWDWKPAGKRAPVSGDCPAPFTWGGQDYLIQGFFHMASRPNESGDWEDWAASGDDIYEGLSVPMVAPWSGDRRIMVGWLRHLYGWGGWLVFRELVRHPDGKLGVKWLAETPAPVPPQTFAVTDVTKPFVVRAVAKAGDTDFEFRIDPAEARAQFHFPRKGESGARVLTTAEFLKVPTDKRSTVIGGHASSGGAFALGKIRGLDKPFTVKLVQYYDAKSDATIFDVEIAGTQTMITCRAGRFAPAAH